MQNNLHSQAVVFVIPFTGKGFLSRTGPDADGEVAESSANGLVSNGFVSRYRLQPRAVLF